ncbi:MAG: hypothetical protein JJU45_16315 [Acidimicrobiia bacterium]|nr:hypothetical protein [Acidimicrobiia bacterium]
MRRAFHLVLCAAVATALATFVFSDLTDQLWAAAAGLFVIGGLLTLVARLRQ